MPADVLDAADGMGYTSRRRLLRVELPLALPAIVAGIRLATVSTIGLVTVTFIVDQGGLGRFIQDGYQRDFHTPLVVGIVLSVALAVVADLLLVRVERAVTPWRNGRAAGGERAPCTFSSTSGTGSPPATSGAASDGVPHLLANHIRVSISSLVVAMLISVPLGAWLGHRRSAASSRSTSPTSAARSRSTRCSCWRCRSSASRARRGFGWTGSFVAFVPLVLLGIPPMLTNSYIGVRDVGDELVDAARGMGLSEARGAAPGRGSRRDAADHGRHPDLDGRDNRDGDAGVVHRCRHARDADLHRAATPSDNVAVFGGAVLVALLAVVADLALAAVQRVGGFAGAAGRGVRGARERRVPPLPPA